MKQIKGDLIKLAEAGAFDVIVHGCNCFNTMGSGIARSLREKYPQVYEADCKTEAGDIGKLGTYTVAFADRFVIVNAYTQFKFNKGAERADVFEYTAFQLVLEKLATLPEPVRFGFPLIGCGLAGGNKTRIIEMLEEFSSKVEKHGGTVTVVEFQ